MTNFLRTVDQLLRGQFTRYDDLSEGRLPVSAQALASAGLVLGGVYGAFLGLYSGLRPQNATWAQVPAAMLKVPLLFLLTLAVTLPSLYVFSALAQSRLRFQETVRLLLAAVVVDLAMLASLGPVTAFFTLSTESYPFMVFLNVCVFALSGIVGITFLSRALRGVFPPPGTTHRVAPAGPEPAAAGDQGEVRAAEPLPREGHPGDHGVPSPDATRSPWIDPHVRAAAARPGPRPSHDEKRAGAILRAWILIYALVGLQMGWILRPFIGNPVDPWALLRPRQSNVFHALLQMVRELFS